MTDLKRLQDIHQILGEKVLIDNRYTVDQYMCSVSIYDDNIQLTRIAKLVSVVDDDLNKKLRIVITEKIKFIDEISVSAFSIVALKKHLKFRLGLSNMLTEFRLKREYVYQELQFTDIKWFRKPIDEFIKMHKSTTN